MGILYTCDNAHCGKILGAQHATLWEAPIEDGMPPRSHTFCDAACCRAYLADQPDAPKPGTAAS